MIEIQDAIDEVLRHASLLGHERVQLAEAWHRILREDVQSDVDSPPHDKALMDGFAVRATDLESGEATLDVVEEITAGAVPTQQIKAGQCARIMTGAPVPIGADAVIQVEHSEIISETPTAKVRLVEPAMKSGHNMMLRAASMRMGETVLEKGRRLEAADIGLLAEVGRDSIAVSEIPCISILSTGNELVPCGEKPDVGQIRNSNGPMLHALVTAAGGRPNNLGIAGDTKEALSNAIQKGLEDDVLLLSGGVSAGVLDLVPSVLMDSGVEQVFHKVNLKPGKPIFFGIKRHPNRQTLVFGLPGNPVSSMVGFSLFVRAALSVMTGVSGISHEQSGRELQAKLSIPFRQRAKRPTYWPSILKNQSGELVVRPLDWKGSADQKTIVSANCLAFFPGEVREFNAGETVSVMRWDQSPID